MAAATTARAAITATSHTAATTPIVTTMTGTTMTATTEAATGMDAIAGLLSSHYRWVMSLLAIVMATGTVAITGITGSAIATTGTIEITAQTTMATITIVMTTMACGTNRPVNR